MHTFTGPNWVSHYLIAELHPKYSLHVMGGEALRFMKNVIWYQSLLLICFLLCHGERR